MEKIKGWKQQFFEVKTIGPTPKETLPPWKKFKPPEIKAVTTEGKKIPASEITPWPIKERDIIRLRQR